MAAVISFFRLKSSRSLRHFQTAQRQSPNPDSPGLPASTGALRHPDGSCREEKLNFPFTSTPSTDVDHIFRPRRQFSGFRCTSKAPVDRLNPQSSLPSVRLPPHRRAPGSISQTTRQGDFRDGALAASFQRGAYRFAARPPGRVHLGDNRGPCSGAVEGFHLPACAGRQFPDLRDSGGDAHRTITHYGLRFGSTNSRSLHPLAILYDRLAPKIGQRLVSFAPAGCRPFFHPE